VLRTRILRRLRAAREQNVVSIVAPAGYGKTNLLAQWARAHDHAAAWLTVDEADNDAARFLNLLAAALGRVVPVDRTIPGAIASRSVQPRDIVGRLLVSVADHGAPLLVAIDDGHRLIDQASLDALAEFVTYLPDRAHIAVAGRVAMRLPFERWRIDDRLVEIGVDQLAMDEREALALARHYDSRLSNDSARRLVEHTSGWPALMALVSVAAHRTGQADLLSSSEPGSLVSEYLRAELLEQRSIGDIEFMTRTSVLERLSGPICDAVLDRAGSAALLDDLARSTLLIDDYAGSFRYHPLLKSFLQHELAMREPGLAPVLHRRAAEWLDSAGDVEQAVAHAFDSGDLDLAARLVGRHFSAYHWSGRRTTLQAWLRRFGDAALQERPWLLVLAAWEATSMGEVGDAERYTALAERRTDVGPSPDGSASLESGRAMLRAGQARRGAAAMLADATLAVELEGPVGRWRDFALLLLYLARRATGDAGGAEEAIRAARIAVGTSRHDGLAYWILGYCATNAMDRDDWDTAVGIVEEAVAIGAGRFDGYPSSIAARVAVARLLHRSGDVPAVKRELAKAAGLRPILTVAQPVTCVDGLLGLARLHLAVGDAGGARALLIQASDIIRQRPGLGVLPAEVEALRRTITGLPMLVSGASALTAAELRVLQLLPYYLSFKEIAQRLGVKATTIKTHALAIYGKLGASSRGEAIDLAVKAGLLEPFVRLRHVSPIEDDAGPEDA